MRMAAPNHLACLHCLSAVRVPSRTYTSVEEHKIKPYELRHLKKHQCVLVHCERGFKRTILAPLEPNGVVSN